MTVEPMFYMAVIKDNARVVPFALGIDKHRVGIGEMHGVVDAEFLPFLEFFGSVDFFPAFVVDELIFGTGHIRNLKEGIFNNVIEHAAVATVAEFPVPVEDEVVELAVGNDVARTVAAFAFGLDAAVDHMPGLGE